MATYSAGFSNSELPSTDSLTLTDLASPVCSVSSSRGMESRQKTETADVSEVRHIGKLAEAYIAMQRALVAWEAYGTFCAAADYWTAWRRWVALGGKENQ